MNEEKEHQMLSKPLCMLINSCISSLRVNVLWPCVVLVVSCFTLSAEMPRELPKSSRRLF